MKHSLNFLILLVVACLPFLFASAAENLLRCTPAAYDTGYKISLDKNDKGKLVLSLEKQHFIWVESKSLIMNYEIAMNHRYIDKSSSLCSLSFFAREGLISKYGEEYAFKAYSLNFFGNGSIGFSAVDYAKGYKHCEYLREMELIADEDFCIQGGSEEYEIERSVVQVNRSVTKLPDDENEKLLEMSCEVSDKFQDYIRTQADCRKICQHSVVRYIR